MNKETICISDRECVIYRQAAPSYLLIQPVDEHDLELMESEVAVIKELSDKHFTLVALKVWDWWSELTPWSAPPTFGKVPFGDKAGETLDFIQAHLLPELKAQGIYCQETMHCLLGGYSLAGLFALWAGYQTDSFDGIAAVSPSVWFPDWTGYAGSHKPLAHSVYLSLGDKEEKAKNPVMSQVGNAIRKQHELLDGQDVKTVLEWNIGNHFVDSDKRTAKGFAWLINGLV